MQMLQNRGYSRASTWEVVRGVWPRVLIWILSVEEDMCDTCPLTGGHYLSAAGAAILGQDYAGTQELGLAELVLPKGVTVCAHRSTRFLAHALRSDMLGGFKIL